MIPWIQGLDRQINVTHFEIEYWANKMVPSAKIKNKRIPNEIRSNGFNRFRLTSYRLTCIPTDKLDGSSGIWDDGWKENRETDRDDDSPFADDTAANVEFWINAIYWTILSKEFHHQISGFRMMNLKLRTVNLVNEYIISYSMQLGRIFSYFSIGSKLKYFSWSFPYQPSDDVTRRSTSLICALRRTRSN